MSDPSPRRRRRWPYVVGALLLALVAVILAFQWDWLIPLIEPRASASLGRPVKISHLHVKLGRVTHIVADGVTIGNPANWQGGGDFAATEHLAVDVEVSPLLHGGQIVLPLIVLDRPNVDAQQLADRTANWSFASGGSSGGAGPQIGKLVINDGRVHVRSAPLNADFEVSIGTKSNAGQDQIVASAKGTYAKQPITAEFTGGALLTLKDTADPYPVDLRLTNGPTSASAVGTIKNPLALAGVDVKLEIAGPNMALLLPLTGIAIPATPPYRVAGKLDYADGVVKFDGLTGKVGSSDLAGSLGVDTKTARPVVTAALQSRKVDLKDLGGFIGAEPGDASKGTKRAERTDGKVLPNDPISVPRLNAADVHLTYKAGRIEGRRQPLDDMQVNLDIVDGTVTLHPLSFGIGKGRIVSQIHLAEQANALDARADIDFQRVDVSKLLNATGVARGAGTIGGRAVIEGNGRSLAEILARGNGEIRLYMGAGGNLSALLVDLSGLQFGNAVLSALGVPDRAQIECLVTDFVLKNGEAQSRLTMLDTNEARIGITGGVSLKTEALALVLRTQSKHFSIGSLPTPIDLGGTMGKPSIKPELAEAGARAAAAVGLGIVLTPLAGLLPTIQTGTGEDGACTGLLREIKAPPRTQADAPSRRRRR